jgi:hypothetical protein
VLHEVGVTKIDVLFAEESVQKQRAKLVCELAEWAAAGQQKYKTYFKKLYPEEENHLGAIEKPDLKSAYDLLVSGKDVPQSLVRKIRRALVRVLADCHRSIPRPSFIEEGRFEVLYSWWSGYMHGNPYMLEHLYDDPKLGNKHRLYGVLWITGLNALYRVRGSIDDTTLLAKIDSVMGKKEQVWQALVASWPNRGGQQ